MVPDSYAPTGPAGRAYAARSDGLLRAALRADGWYAAWRGTAHLAAGLPIAVLSAPALLVLPLFGLPTLGVLLAAVRLFTRWHRARFAECLGVTVPPRADRFAAPSWLGRVLAEARAATTWRQLGYHLAAAVLAPVSFLVCAVGWAVGLSLTTVWAYAWTLPDRNVLGLSPREPVILTALTGAGLVCCLAVRWLAIRLVAWDTRAAGALLGPSRTERLSRRVEALTASRNALVDAADAERRRIERDLHDGAQQRLTALAMNLGMLRQEATGLPEPVRSEIVRAHEDAKLALAELRRLVRGLHPAVLDARGLDAALSGLAAGAPVPVRLRVDLPDRPPPAVGAVAYFVVAEALTNAARHAGATGVVVSAERRADRLHVEISDDGRGGARPGIGTGLHGLAQRVASVDGTLEITSPLGGGTRITVELPCGS
ncbi:sensor histidine kinase [Plantactinospora sp. B5E13]|uniref:sensor histidine kinase n=1 Tax=unclassified Plantactinospora TaxID=2631981 RepID=UPI00325EB699